MINDIVFAFSALKVKIDSKASLMLQEVLVI